MKKVLFCGCSFTKGSGFELQDKNPNLWVNLLHSQGKFSDCHLTNVAVEARSNSGIFQDSVYNLLQDHYNYAVIAWTSVPRYELDLGIETYTTKVAFMPRAEFRNINCNNIQYSSKYLKKINDRFTALATYHREILNLVYYVNALVNLAKKTNTKIFFVNALCPWDENYFVQLSNVLPNQYTAFTQEILNIKNRDDAEIFVLYNKIHQEYQQAGSIHKHYWLNLYQSLRSLRIDVNNDKVHPGIKSNQLYFELLNQQLDI